MKTSILLFTQASVMVVALSLLAGCGQSSKSEQKENPVAQATHKARLIRMMAPHCVAQW